MAKTEKEFVELDDIKEHYRNIIENSLVGIYRTTPSGEILMANPSLVSMLGYSNLEELSKVNLEKEKSIMNISRNHFKNELEKKGNISGLEYKWKRPDGTFIHVRENAKVIRDKDGKALYYDGMVEDITETKRTKKALREKEQLYQSLVDISPVPIIITNIQGEIQEISRRTEKLWRLATDRTLIGNDLLSLVSPYHRKKCEMALTKILKKTNITDLQLDLKRNDGSVFVGELNSSLIKGHNGESKYIIHTIRDITEHKEMEMEMKRRLMKFNLDNGNLYLIKEASSSLSHAVFTDLLKVEFEGVVISRKNPKELKEFIKKEVDYYWLSEKKEIFSKEYALQPHIKNIINTIEHLPKRKAILIDRLDYIITKNSFEEALSLVQTLGEIAYYSDHIIILTVDENILNGKELALLNNETREVYPFQKAWLPEELLEVLKLVYGENKIGSKPTHTRVSKVIGISKPTAGKRIRQLVDSGFLMETPEGKSKILELSPDGKRLFLENE